MPDLTAQLLPRLETNRLPGLDFGDGFIYPDYNGGSILNIPASLCQLLGIPELNGNPLHAEILSPLLDGGPVRRIVLVLMDALSLHRLQRWTQGRGLGETAPVWQQTARDGLAGSTDLDRTQHHFSSDHQPVDRAQRSRTRRGRLRAVAERIWRGRQHDHPIPDDFPQRHRQPGAGRLRS